MKKQTNKNRYFLLNKLKLLFFILYFSALGIVHHFYSNAMEGRMTGRTDFSPFYFETNTNTAQKPVHTTRLSSLSNNKKAYSTDCSTWDEYAPCKKLWQGDSLFPDALPNDIKVSVVINYCSGDLKLLTDYINDVSTMVTGLTIITRCPVVEDIAIPNDSEVIEMVDNRKSPDLSIAKYLSTIPQSSNGESHVTLFLNSKSFEYKYDYRSVRRVLRAAMQNGFGCVRETSHPTHSIYHDVDVLRTFQGEDYLSKQSKYSNLGNWLDDMQISFDDITQVCYTSSFGVKTSQIFSSHLNTIISSIIESLEENGDNSVIDEFVERTWAGIFSNRLKDEQVNSLRNNTYKIIPETCCLTGALCSDSRKKDNTLPYGWK